MILTPRELKYFVNFKREEVIHQKNKTTFEIDIFDEITLKFIQDKPTIFGGTKEKNGRIHISLSVHNHLLRTKRGI